MKKRIVIFFATMSMAVTPIAAYGASATAYQKEVNVVINNAATDVFVYNVDDYNYFRLRDLCALVDFDVQWNTEMEAVQVDTTKGYDILQGGGGVPIIEKVSTDIVEATVYVNGTYKKLKAVNIGGYNYVQLRDFADLTKQSSETRSNIGNPYLIVDWNDIEKAISITTIGNVTEVQNSNTVDETKKNNDNVFDTDYEKQRSEWEQGVMKLVNEERAEAGLSEVVVDENLMALARWRAEELYKYKVRGHVSPTYNLSGTELAQYLSVNCKYAGENVYAFHDGIVYPLGAMDTWMSSDGHKALILLANGERIGVGYHKGCWSLWIVY